jgi:hypothetical protein
VDEVTWGGVLMVLIDPILLRGCVQLPTFSAALSR